MNNQLWNSFSRLIESVTFCIILGCSSIALADPLLSLGSVNVLQGQTNDVDLRLSGCTTPYAGVNAKILLPAGVTVVSVSRGKLMPIENCAADFRTFSAGGTNGVAVIAYSGACAFKNIGGALLNLTLRAATNAPLGTYPILFAPVNTTPQVNANHALSDASGSKSVDHTIGAGTLTIDRDSNTNSMGDCWETDYFGATVPQGSEDADQDGVNNLREYQNGTHPKLTDSDGDGQSDAAELIAGTDGADSADYFRVNDYEYTPDAFGFVLYFDTVTGRTYTVYNKANLLSFWDSVYQTPGDNSMKSYTNADTISPRQFFRLGVKKDQ